MTTPAELVRSFQPPTLDGPSKVMTLADAVRAFVAPASTIHFGYSNGRCYAAKIELVRQFSGRDPQFTVIAPSVANTGVALFRAGLVKKIVAPSLGEIYPSAMPNPVVQRAIDSGTLTIENWSLLTYVERLRAGATGLPFVPTRSLIGSDLATSLDSSVYQELDNPFGPGKLGAIAAVHPDVSILQAIAADRHGNVVMAAPYGEGLYGALASRKGVIVCVEKIVSTSVVRAHSALVRIPAHCVLAVCEVPLGGHPFGLFNPGLPGVTGYGEDRAFIGDVVQACRTDDAFDEWMREWVYGTRDHSAWLAKLGDERIERLRAAADPDAWMAEASQSWVDAADSSFVTPSEAQAVVGARAVGRILNRGEHSVLLAGVGLSSLSSWSAVRAAKRRSIDVELLAEIGMYGYSPLPGDPYVFSNRNVFTAKGLWDVSAVLGTLVSGFQNRCLGVIGCNLVDPYGNIGTTYGQDGQFLYGSGGANDICSGADEVVATTRLSRARCVESLRYVTSPGSAVRTLATDLGIFERASSADRFTLTSVLVPPGRRVPDVVENIRSRTSWDVVPVAADLEVLAAPSAEELQEIRLYDPERVLLGPRPDRWAAPSA